MKKIVVATFMFFSIIGCQSDDDNQTGGNNTPTTIKFTTLGKGDSYSSPPVMPMSYYYVLHNQSEWEGFKDETGILANTSVDFTVNEVIVVFDQYRESSGFAIEIKSITKIDGKLTVKIERSQPEDGEPMPTIQSQPYHAVKIQKNGLPVVFEENQPL